MSLDNYNEPFPRAPQLDVEETLRGAMGLSWFEPTPSFLANGDTQRRDNDQDTERQ